MEPDGSHRAHDDPPIEDPPIRDPPIGTALIGDECGPALVAAIDQVITFFNARRLDLPDGFFDRRTQFVINGTRFESLLGQSPNDPLILMLSRGPAGFRFATKALQHAIPNARFERASTRVSPAGSSKTALALRLTGTLRGIGESVNTIVSITLHLAEAGHIEVAEASVDPETLEKIRLARLRS